MQTMTMTAALETGAVKPTAANLKTADMEATQRARFDEVLKKDGAEKALELIRAGTFSSSPRTSSRWIGRTKGEAFSRCRVDEMIPAHPALPGSGVIVLVHPTRKATKGRRHVIAADRAACERWVPKALHGIMLGEAV